MRAIERAVRGAKNEWRMHAVGALSTSVAFLCLAFALLLVTNLERLERRWQTAGQLSAYLAPEVRGPQVSEIVRVLRETSGVAKVRYLSSEASRSELLESTTTTLLEALPSGAFPASIEIELAETIALDRARTIARQLQSVPGIESLETYGTWTARVSRFVRAANLVAVCLTLVVFFAVVTVVGSTTKLMLERRRDEVEVLRTVGATTEYVRGPFLLEGAFQGVLGACGALVLCALVHVFLNSRFDAELQLLLGVELRFLSLPVNLMLLGTGALLGTVAAFLSLRRSFNA